MMTRTLSILLLMTLFGCAAQISPVAATEPSPEVQRRVDDQIAALSLNGETPLVERRAVKGKNGWRMTYNVANETWTGPRTDLFWVDLDASGFYAGSGGPPWAWQY